MGSTSELLRLSVTMSSITGMMAMRAAAPRFRGRAVHSNGPGVLCELAEKKGHHDAEPMMPWRKSTWPGPNPGQSCRLPQCRPGACASRSRGRVARRLAARAGGSSLAAGSVAARRTKARQAAAPGGHPPQPTGPRAEPSSSAALKKKGPWTCGQKTRRGRT
jgi:hypothetical protein